MINLKHTRQIREMSMRDLQNKSGVGHNYICLAENGRYKPSASQLKRIAIALDWQREPLELMDDYKED